MSDPKTQQEPTMEEILASIRRIISEDGDEAQRAAPDPGEPAAGRQDEVLELTQMVKDDGSVVNLTRMPELGPEPEPPGQAAPAPDSELLSADAASAAASAFSGLAGMLSASPRGGMPLGDGQRTLEDLVRELLRPMLKQWLDANLPGLVQRVVEREVTRLARQAEHDPRL